MNKSLVRSKYLIGAAVVAFGLCYAGVIAGLVETWSTNYLYSYGFVVPLIAGYMVWTKWSELLDKARAPDYPLGCLAISVGLTMLVAGRLGAAEGMEQVSLTVVLFGVVLVAFGRHALSVTWFPIVYLLLAIPVWDRVIGELQIPSQTLSARISASLLRLCGIPALHQATQVVLPNLTLDVLRECSGVNQLISVVTMTLPAAYLWLQGPTRRIVLMIVALLVAYLSNGIRIALVGFLGYNGWSNGAVGTLHLMEGLAVSLIGYGLIFGCLTLLSRKKRVVREADGSRNDRPGTTYVPNGATRLAGRDIALVMLVLCVGTFRVTFRSSAVHLPANLGALPSQIGNWTEDASEHSRDGFRLAGVDDELVRTYRNLSGERVRLYVGYHQYQSEGKELARGINRSTVVTKAPVNVRSASASVDLNEVVRQQSDTRSGMLFWYDVNGRILTSLYLAKGYTIWDAITRGRTNGAMVSIEWQAAPGESFEHSRHEAIGFAGTVVPLLRQYLPSESVPQTAHLSVSLSAAE